MSTDPAGLDKLNPEPMAAWLRETAANTRRHSNPAWCDAHCKPYDPLAAHVAFRMEQAALLLDGLSGLARFGAWCFDSHRGDCSEPGDIDGGSIQGKLVELGLLEPREMTSPCGPQCVCGPSKDYPCECYFTAPGLRELIARIGA